MAVCEPMLCKPMQHLRNMGKMLPLGDDPRSPNVGKLQPPENQSGPWPVSPLASVRIGPRWFRMRSSAEPRFREPPMLASG